MKRTMQDRMHIKERYRSVFLALQSDCRHTPGGIPELAATLGRNYGTLRNAICPTSPDAEPTLELLLELVEHVHGERTVCAIAQLAGLTAMRIPTMHGGSPAEVTHSFLHVVKEAGRVNERTAEALEDGRLDARERLEVGDYLDQLIAAAVEMRALVRG